MTVPTTDLTNLSYAQLDDANNYFAWSLNSDAWDEASNDDKCKALVSATRRIDRLNFAGERTSDYNRFRTTLTNAGFVMGPMSLDPSSTQPSPGQPLEFPRNGETAYPQDIIDATCEIAIVLLDGVDPEQEMRGLHAMSHRFAATSSSFDPAAAQMALRHGIPSYTAWNLLYGYLADPLEINTKRIS